MVVEGYRFTLIKRPTYALLFVGLKFTGRQRGKRLPMIIGPEAKLIYLLRAASLIHYVSMLPTIARLAHLEDPRIRAPKAYSHEVNVANKGLRDELHTSGEASVPNGIFNVRPWDATRGGGR